jgi:hypothetical protein
MDRHTGILVDVHPELRLKVGGLPNPNLAALLRMTFIATTPRGYLRGLNARGRAHLA